ncbi:hypothetical protein [Nocardia sp. NPDC005998]|uniref:hypothetical protein n=1 Tax=Nocardia sp. NPDC005998 TaxID=3156894 RepID=UPI0033BA9FC1
MIAVPTIIASRPRPAAAALLVAAAGILVTGAITTGTATLAAPIVPATTCDRAADPDCTEPGKKPDPVIVPAPVGPPLLTPAMPPPPAKPSSPAAALTPPAPGPNPGTPIVPAAQ